MAPRRGHRKIRDDNEADRHRTDGSSGSRAAAATGLELARALGATVTFIAVRPHIPEDFGDAVAAAGRNGVEAEAVIAEGDPVDELLRVAGARHADLIIVGSRGLGAVAGALLGSVSRALVQHAPLSVLVVKEQAGRP